ncbi:hypothetical protein EMGBS6_17750 [Opitutia bacterium]|nr:hypothetical protein EMGBS6_17750 [Opitutae bacterium]
MPMKVLSDVISRHVRMSGRKVHFLTGLDEHGQKIQHPPQLLLIFFVH